MSEWCYSVAEKSVDWLQRLLMPLVAVQEYRYISLQICVLLQYTSPETAADICVKRNSKLVSFKYELVSSK